MKGPHDWVVAIANATKEQTITKFMPATQTTVAISN